ncbi:MAG: hypothetical protein PUF10_05730 [Bacteroidales bacterium]|nr:hypothetical protein [Bacteroidales bacterium]
MKSIKKIAMAALVCAVVFGFTSCNKDGVYKPKEKIEKIYVQYEGQDKVLTETWDWEDNLLKSIKHADTDPIGDNSYTETFTYDKKQVKSISDGTYTMTYNYDGRYFDNIKVTEGSDEVGTMTFSHDGKLISKIDITLNDDDFMKSRMAESAMRFIAPEFACDFGKIMQAEAQRGFKGKTEMVVSFEYDGVNVQKAIVRNNTANVEQVFTYTYSDYMNPFYKLFSHSNDNNAYNQSKNAPATIHETNSAWNSTTWDYTYTYPSVDHKYPTQMTEKKVTTQVIGNMTNTINNTTSYFYEYDD